MSGSVRDLLIGIDAGTSVIKAIAFDLEGRQLAEAATPNRYETRPDGAAFQSLEQTWSDCALVLRTLAQRLPNLAARTAAIGVTAQGDGTWLVGRENRPVGDGWLWLDGRAGPTVRRMRAQPSDRRRFETTGTGLNVCQQGAQLAHMLAATPEAIESAEVALHCKDWLYLRLTDVRATDPSEAVFTFGDFRTRRYDDGVIDALGLTRSRRLLPEIIDGRHRWDPLSAQAARDTGLLRGTPVALAYVDVVCTAIGGGIHTGGAPARCTIIGSTGMHMRAGVVDDVRLNDERTGYTMLLPFDGMCAQMQSNMAATLNIDWALALVGDLMAEMGRPVPRAELIGRIGDWISKTRPGALLYHPYISEAGERGPFVNDRARAGFVGLNASHRFPDLIRAVVEGVALAARDCYAAMGESASEVRLSGGASRSQALREILAAILNAPVRVAAREEAGAAGAAMMASVSVGLHRDMDAAVAQWVTPTLGPVETPDATLADAYGRLFSAYVLTRKSLEPVWDQLANRD